MESHKLDLGNRIKIRSLLIFLLFFIYVGFILQQLISIHYQEASLIKLKDEQPQRLIESVMSIVGNLKERADKGEFSAEEAKERAKAIIRTIRYGDKNLDYFWINDTNHVMVMHPFKPELEGKSVIDVKDPEGVYVFREAVKASSGAEARGKIHYHWQYYAEKDRIEEKSSYVAKFTPWSWVIGTGVYMDDIEAMIEKSRKQVVIGFFAIFSFRFSDDKENIRNYS